MQSKFNQTLADEITARWAEQTASLEELRPRIPLDIFLAEALSVARVVEDCWDTKVVAGRKRLGLDSVAASGSISRETATEIRELQVAVSEAKADYDTLVQYSNSAPVDEGDAMLGEFTDGLSYLLEDGKHERGAMQLAQLRDIHGDASSQLAMAMALEGYAELAQEYRDELAQLARFPMEIIDEALRVAHDLRVRSSERATGEIFERQHAAIALRNRLVRALSDRVSEARRAIRYVFKGNDKILKRAASQYKRAARRSSAQDGTAAEDIDAINPAEPPAASNRTT